jgi:hypothetical protein
MQGQWDPYREDFEMAAHRRMPSSLETKSRFWGEIHHSFSEFALIYR